MTDYEQQFECYHRSGTMTDYEQQFECYQASLRIEGKAKQALALLNEMDCVKALGEARWYVEMLKLKCDEAQA